MLSYLSETLLLIHLQRGVLAEGRQRTKQSSELHVYHIMVPHSESLAAHESSGRHRSSTVQDRRRTKNRTVVMQSLTYTLTHMACLHGAIPESKDIYYVM